MRDNIKSLRCETNPLANILGHVRIDIHDTNTGSNERIEGDNTFQSGILEQYMKSLGYYVNSPYANSTWRGQMLWRNLVGGILLFKDSIDITNGDVAHMPAGNSMTANGAFSVSNSSTPTELGSYNATESSITTSGITMVYDWGTSQGNGQIGSVCLTSETGGYIGYGNATGNSASLRSIVSNQSSSEIATANEYSNAVHENSIYSTCVIDISNSKVTLGYKNQALSKATLFDGMERTIEYTYTGDLSDSLNTYASAQPKICIDGDYIYVLPYYSTDAYITVPNNGTYKYIKIDTVNNTATVETLTNSTGQYIFIGYMRNVLIDDGYLYVTSDTGNSVVYDKAYTSIIKLSDSSYIGRFNTVARGLANMCKLSDGLIMHAVNTSGKMSIYDTVTQTDYPTNGSMLMYSGSTWINQGFITDNYNANQGIMVSQNVYSDKISLYKNPLYLATVYNLDNTLTKTASQTMKITYTLTEAEE